MAQRADRRRDVGPDRIRNPRRVCGEHPRRAGARRGEPRLRERSFGHFQGRTFAEIEAELPEDALRWRKRDPHYTPEGGESLVTLRERIERTVNALARQHVGEQVVMVAHGGVLDVLYRLATRQDIQAPRTWQLANAAINRLLWTPDGLTLVGWADTQHLEQIALRDENHA